MANSIAYLASEVYNVTRRPDLSNQTAQAIRTATLMLHQRAYYSRDMQEFFIDFEQADFLQQFQYKSYIPFWRSLAYFKHPESAHVNQQNVIYCGNQWARNNKEFKVIEVNNIFDYFGTLKADVAYLSGINWNLRGSWAFQRVRCGCYVNPNVTNDGYASWIADDHEFAVVYKAAALIFKQVGLDAEAAVAETEVDKWIAIIDAVNTVGVGN